MRKSHPQRMLAPVPDAARQSLGQTEAALYLAQPDRSVVRRGQAALEIGGHLLATNSWQIEREQSIVGHGGLALSLSVKKTV